MAVCVIIVGSRASERVVNTGGTLDLRDDKIDSSSENNSAIDRLLFRFREASTIFGTDDSVYDN